MIEVVDETPWLDEEEMRIWRAFLEAAGRVSNELDAALRRDAAMTLDDYEVLVHLSEAPDERLRMSELSHRLLHSQPRLTQRIDRLVDRGWVRRERCDEDRRGTYAVITAEGRTEIEATAPAHVRDVRELLVDRIEPKERRLVADVLERIADHARSRAATEATR